MKKGKILGALLVTFLSSTAMADNTSANFQATANLNASCSISATDVNFGTIKPGSTGTVEVNGEIRVTCSNGLRSGIVISAGSSGSDEQRTMKGSNADNNDKLNYNLYSDSYGDSVWGSTPSHGVTVVLTGVVRTIPVYGKLKLKQYVQPDTYSDNLTVTVNY